jgi:phosphate transport system substrate-binding protein
LDRRKGEKYITNVIALDAMVALVPQSQSVSKITQFELEKIMTGKINNWQALGGLNSRIHLVVPKTDSDEGQVVDAAARALLERNASKLEVDSVVGQLARNSRALGIGAFHNSVNQKRLIISSSANDAGFAPSPFTIATEVYRYPKRVFGHSSKQRTPDVEKFMGFVLSDEGQKIVAEAGYIDTRPYVRVRHPPKYVEDAIGADKILAAYKVSSNFRFALDSSDLDIKARGDVERVKDSLTLHLNKKKECLIVGFTDNQGASDYNLVLSRKRALHVSTRIMSSSIRGNLTTYGCGMDWPIADNDTHRGKAQNRRVEVWIIETR